MTNILPFYGDILLDGDRILRLEERIDPATLRPETPVLDAAGQHVWPGFIDVHTHLGLSDDQTEPDPADPAFQQAAEAGVTTVAVCPVASSPAPQRCTVWHTGRDPERIGAPELVKLALDGADVAETEALLRTYARQGVRIKAQAHGEAAIRLALRLHQETGAVLTLEHLTDGAALAQEIARSGLTSVLGASCRRGSASSYALAAKLWAWGADVVLSTGHPSSRIHHLPLCAGLSMRAGMTEDAAMAAITSRAAAALGLEEELGSLQPGRMADLTLTDGSPLHLATAIRCTIVAGRVQYQR